MARNWFKNRALSRQTTASITYTDVLSLTFIPNSSATYYILWSALFDCSVTNSNANHRLRNDTSSSNLASPVHRAPNSSDIMSVGGVAKWVSGAAPGSQTFSVEHAVDVVTATVGTADAYLVAIEAAADDTYAESVSNSSTTSNVLSDKVTLNFTPSTAGEYIIICSCEIAGFIPSSTDGVGRVLLDVNGNQYFDTIDGYFSQTNSQYASWCHAITISFSPSMQSLKIRFASSDNTTTAQIRQARILAVRLDSFSRAHTAQNVTRQTTIQQTPQVAAGITFDAVSNDYLFISTALVDHSTSVSTMEVKIDWAGASHSSLKRRQVSASGARRASYLALGYDSLSVGSQTTNIDWWRTVGGTAGITDAFIGAFLLDVVDTDIPVPVIPQAVTCLAPAVAVGAAVGVPVRAVSVVPAVPVVSASVLVAVPGAIAGFAARVPAVAVGAAVAIGPGLVAAVCAAPALAVGVVIRVAAGAVALRGRQPVRAGPVWRAVNENQAVWGDVAPAISTWSPVPAA